MFDIHTEHKNTYNEKQTQKNTKARFGPSYDLCPETEQALLYSSWGPQGARLESSAFTLRSVTR